VVNGQFKVSGRPAGRGRRKTDSAWHAAVIALGNFAAALIAVLGLLYTLGVRWRPYENDLRQDQRIDTIAAQLRNTQADVARMKIREFFNCTQQQKMPAACEDILK